MALANLSNKIRLYINEIDYTDYLIAGSASDDSSYSNHIVTTTGEVVLGSSPALLDYNKTLFPIGSRVTMYATLDNGKLAKLPRGHLFVLNSSINIAERTTTLEVGCSLAYLSAREGNYTTYVEDLFDTFLSAELKDSFVIDNYNLSTLENLLEIDGRIIYQDRWGYVQAIDLFGNDGQGSNIKDAKLTCFDKHSSINIESLGGSIEDIPASILVEAEFDAPITTTQNVTGNNYYPPPFTTSQTVRIAKRLDAESVGKFYIQNLPDTGDAANEANAVGFLSRDTTLEEPPKYGHTITANAYTIERETQETVTNHRQVEYNGPGNQVSWEYQAEICSALTYGKSLIDGVINKYISAVNQEIQKANSLLSKANQTYALRDDYGGRDLDNLNAFTISQVEDLYGYNAALATQYYSAAEDIGEFGAKALMEEAAKHSDNYGSYYAIANITNTFNTYGSSGELRKKVVNKYIHKAQSKKAQAALDALQIEYQRSNPVLDSTFQYKYDPTLDFTPFREILGVSYNATLGGTINNPSKTIDRNSNQVLASKTTTEYFYGTNWSKEVETFEDFEDPSNNYKRTSWSSSGSKNAPAEDRIVIERDINGCVYLTDDNSESDTRTIQYLQEIDIANPLGTPSIPAGWLGQATATQKTVQLPLSFAPIRAKSCNGVITYPNLAEKVNIYNKIIQKYASNLAKKYTADNFGYRISEKGIRAEIFDYYPFYPISLSLASLSKNYKLRAASSTWVFDSENVLCSFDCYNVGDIAPASSTQIVTPYIYIAFKKVDSSATLDSQFFNVPETTSYIEILNLPNTGSVYLSGVLVSVGDTINVSDINANNVTFTPSSSGTVEVGIAYEAYDSSNERINSDWGIYPNLQVSSTDNVVIDGGEFTLNTSNNGDNTDAGDFDTGVANTVGGQANAGDFNTGTAVPSYEPQAPSGASTSNGSVNPETSLGLTVLDASNNSISTYKLPTPKGNLSPAFEVAGDFRVSSAVFLTLNTTVVLQDGWDYGAIAVGTGTTIDFGTIVDPNTYGIDFGTITAPLDPTIASSVV